MIPIRKWNESSLVIVNAFRCILSVENKLIEPASTTSTFIFNKRITATKFSQRWINSSESKVYRLRNSRAIVIVFRRGACVCHSWNRYAAKKNLKNRELKNVKNNAKTIKSKLNGKICEEKEEIAHATKHLMQQQNERGSVQLILH